MKERVLSNWNWLRFIRLFIGIIAVIQGISQGETLLIIAGIFLLLSALLNFGCCGSTGCPISFSKKQTGKEVEYEEVDASK